MKSASNIIIPLSIVHALIKPSPSVMKIIPTAAEFLIKTQVFVTVLKITCEADV